MNEEERKELEQLKEKLNQLVQSHNVLLTHAKAEHLDRANRISFGCADFVLELTSNELGLEALQRKFNKQFDILARYHKTRIKGL